MIVTVYGQEIPCTRAVKGPDFIRLYDGEVCMADYSGICDFSGYGITGGDWSEPEVSAAEQLRADVDFIAVMTGVEL